MLEWARAALEPPPMTPICRGTKKSDFTTPFVMVNHYKKRIRKQSFIQIRREKLRNVKFRYSRFWLLLFELLALLFELLAFNIIRVGVT